MTNQTKAEYLLAQAAFADSMTDKIEDSQVKESWQRIADSCRELARFHREGRLPTVSREPAP